MRIGYGTSITVPAATERWLSDLRAGRCFSLTLFSAAVAAQYSYCQLFNPLGSGKQILVRQMNADAPIQTIIVAALYNTALATLVGNGTNLLSGGAASVGEGRTGSDANPLGTGLASYDVLANTPIFVGNDWIAELSPGMGIIARVGTVNNGTRATFTWSEV